MTVGNNDSRDYALRRPGPTPPTGFDGLRVGVLAANLAPAADGGFDPIDGVLRVYGAGVRGVRLTGNPTGGTWSMTVNGQTASGLSRTITASALESALVALSSVDTADIRVYGDDLPTGPLFFLIRPDFVLSEFTASGASLTGGTSPAAVLTDTWGWLPKDELGATGLTINFKNYDPLFAAKQFDVVTLGRFHGQWMPLPRSEIRTARLLEPLYRGVGTVSAVLVDGVNEEPITVSQSTARGFYFTGDIVELRGTGPLWYPMGTGYSHVRGVLDGTLTTTGTQTVSAWTWSGSAKVDSGDNLASVRSSFTIATNVPSGTQVVCHEMGAAWFAYVEACP